MFTGLIEDTGRITALEQSGSAGTLTLQTGLSLEEIKIGDSVAVNGACLTVIGKAAGLLRFDISPETISRTTFSTARPGRPVNLERALRLGDRLGGHIVSGHIDCLGQLVARREQSGNLLMEFRLPQEYARYLVEKGSIAIDGISLTVNEVGRDSFSVNIIPLTQAETTLQSLRPGDAVNLETDIIGKYVERLAQPWSRPGGLSMKTLAENGFI